MAGDNGWAASASAWIADMGTRGDYARRHVLDAPMLARIRGRGFRDALDVGCGEGRFCRMLRTEGISATGIEPTAPLCAEAKARDPGGNYLQGTSIYHRFRCSGPVWRPDACWKRLLDVLRSVTAELSANSRRVLALPA